VASASGPIAGGALIWASTILSNVPALSSSDEGDAGSCQLLGGLARKTSATEPGYCIPRGIKPGMSAVAPASENWYPFSKFATNIKNLIPARPVDDGMGSAIAATLNRLCATP
jgi:hypothetical protein